MRVQSLPLERRMARRGTDWKLRVAVALLGLAASYAPACSSDDEHVPDPRLRGVVYELGTNEDALVSLISTNAQTNVPSAPTLVAPTRGPHVPDAPPLTFSWKPGVAARGIPKTTTRFTAATPFGPIALASAHGAVLNGPGYFVVLSAPGDPNFHRVFTTGTSYRPDDQTWARMKNVRSSIVLTVTAADFENNRVVVGRGPFASDSVPFDLIQ